jgi:AcrR family transcriptional regulator
LTQPAQATDDLEPYGRALPRGGKQLPIGRRFSREFVLRSQRERLLDAMAHAVAQKGYKQARVADVVAAAGVSRKTFYEMFADKEACFLAAYEAIFSDIMASVLEAYESRRRWPDRVSAALAALLDRLASEPDYARAGIVEVLAAGTKAIAARDAALVAFRTFFDPSRPEVPDRGIPPIVAEATVGGIYEVMYRWVIVEGPESLRSLHRELVHLALAPLLGPKAALRESGLEVVFASIAPSGQPRPAGSDTEPADPEVTSGGAANEPSSGDRVRRLE